MSLKATGENLLSLRQQVTEVLRELSILETDDDKTREYMDRAIASLADAECELDNSIINLTFSN